MVCLIVHSCACANWYLTQFSRQLVRDWLDLDAGVMNSVVWPLFFTLSYLISHTLSFYLMFFRLCLAMGSSSLPLYSLDTCHIAVVWAVVLLLFRIALCCVILPCYFFYCFFTSFIASSLSLLFIVLILSDISHSLRH